MFTVASEGLQIIRVTQIYGLTALTLLYTSLIITPLRFLFPRGDILSHVFKAQPLIVLATCYFALLHSSIAFFGQLGGFPGLPFLSGDYLLALSSSATAFCMLILYLVLVFVLRKVHPDVKRVLNVLLYLSGILILFHIALIGTHFQDLTGIPAQIVYISFGILIVLESIRLDAWFKHRFHFTQQLGIATVIAGALVLLVGVYLFTPFALQEKPSLSTHNKHASKSSGQNAMHATMQGDTSLRFTVGFDKPDVLQPNQTVPLTFEVFNAATGSPITLYQKFFEKESHLIIVDNNLQYFKHIHPVRVGNTFTVNTTFPKAGTYRAYLTYQPIGAVEQQVAFSFPVGSTAFQPSTIQHTEDADQSKTFGEYNVSLSTNTALTASAMQSGNANVSFFLREKSTNEPVTNLKPYLGAFGHLVMIHTKDYSYIHVHPVGAEPKADQTSGPEVQFQPMPLTDTVKPGIYRVFAEFNPDGNIFVSDYTIEVK